METSPHGNHMDPDQKSSSCIRTLIIACLGPIKDGMDE